jgi:hypothetical protein
MPGLDREIPFECDGDTLRVAMPQLHPGTLPCGHAYAFKVTR